jgi:hypothetical protein
LRSCDTFGCEKTPVDVEPPKAEQRILINAAYRTHKTPGFPPPKTAQDSGPAKPAPVSTLIRLWWMSGPHLSGVWDDKAVVQLVS